MKKLVSLILFSIITTFAFAEHSISLSGVGTIGFESYNLDSNYHDCQNLKFGVSAQYVNVFKNGFSVGADITVLGTNYTDVVESNNIRGTINSDGSGISVAPIVGWSYIGNVAFIQLLVYPIIYETVKYTQHTPYITSSLGKIEYNPIYEDIEKNYFKTGFAPTFQWGWKHFKLGIGAGLNVIWFTNHNNESIKPNIGCELSIIEKLTFLF